MTTVHLQRIHELVPPYVVALVELVEGPRLLTNIVNPPCSIGDAVELTWGQRDGHKVPLFQVPKGHG